jgi:2-iminobutanoate/2-iminopropanoate deaminase
MLSKAETFIPPDTHKHDRSVQPILLKSDNSSALAQRLNLFRRPNHLAGPDVYSQTRQIFKLFKLMLGYVNSDLNHVIHIYVFLKDTRDFEELNRAYIEAMRDHLPARAVLGVNELPKPCALLTMNPTAVERELNFETNLP